jgi:hypothetical protein
MLLPDYWLPRPSVAVDPIAHEAFDALWGATLGTGGCPSIAYTLPYPKWQFLCHLADQHAVALHGSGDAGIDRFEPRQPNDITEFGNQKAVYAAADGLWAMFFAVVDRGRVGSIINACIRIADGSGTVHGPFYVFSVSQSALAHRPWRSGMLYLLPRSSFIAQPPESFGSLQVHIAQLASFEAVRPLAKLSVTPEDFPFLALTRGHDDERLQEYAAALQTGAPWPDDL